QIDLLRRYRAAEGEEERNEALHRLLLSINCVAAGFGATGGTGPSSSSPSSPPPPAAVRTPRRCRALGSAAPTPPPPAMPGDHGTPGCAERRRARAPGRRRDEGAGG